MSANPETEPVHGQAHTTAMHMALILIPLNKAKHCASGVHGPKKVDLSIINWINGEDKE